MIRITGDKVAVIPIHDPDISPGGIIIPDEAKDRADQGIVKYIGPDVKTVKPGMYVIFSGYTGTLLTISGEGKIIIMPEDYITAELIDVPNKTIPGLFFQADKDDYFPATYEMAMNLIAEQFEIFSRTLNVKHERPTYK